MMNNATKRQLANPGRSNVHLTSLGLVLYIRPSTHQNDPYRRPPQPPLPTWLPPPIHLRQQDDVPLRKACSLYCCCVWHPDGRYLVEVEQEGRSQEPLNAVVHAAV